MIDMLEETTIEGFWWKPKAKRNKAPGVLSFSQTNGIRLRLMGSIDDRSVFDIFADPKTESLDALYGFSDDGKAVTLLNCQLFPNTLNMASGLARMEAIAQFVIVGRHVKNLDEPVFNSLLAQYYGLTNWLNKSGLRTNLDNLLDGRASISYKKPRETKITLERGVFLTIFSTLGSINFSKPHFVEKTFGRFETRKVSSIRELLEYSKHFQDFLTLGTRSVCFPFQISLSDKKTKLDTSLFYTINADTRAKEIKPFDMLFSFAMISRSFGKTLQNWYLKKEGLSPISQLYFSVLRQPTMYQEHKFLNLIQGLEAYHRSFIRNQEYPPAEYKLRRKLALKNVPKSVEPWVSSNLNNEPSLRSRLTELINNNESTVGILVSDFNEFINTVVETRRFYTHHTQGKNPKAAKPRELIRLIKALTLLFERVLINELELPKKRIDTIVSRQQSLGR